MKSRIVVYDIECIKNFFCYCDIDRDTLETHIFIIHKSLNQLDDLYNYLNTKIKQVGFNNLNYDSQLIHYIIENYHILKQYVSTDLLCEKLSEYSNGIINETIKRKYTERNFKISQLDLFRIWHFDNKAKSTRLKDLQIAMRWHNVQDMPIHHNSYVNEDQIPMILDYCMNDVLSTLEFYKLSREKIDLRTELSKIYGINLINANDGKIGSNIFLKILSEKKDLPPDVIRSMRTFRSKINIKDCILPIIKFKSKELNNALDRFRNTILTEKDEKGGLKLKKTLEFSINYKGLNYDFGLGGLHSCYKEGVYVSDKDYVIKSHDITSMYPRTAINNMFYPEHLGEEFVEIYDEIFNARNAAKKKYKLDKLDFKSKSVNEGLKYGLNIPYGKSNEIDSFFYDPKFTINVTVNGQLMLAMLSERLQDAGFTVLMNNTDGSEILVPRDKVHIYDEICKQWMNETKFDLDFTEYDKLVIRDINNYIGIYKNMSDVKYKGVFEIVKEYHKDPSFPIIPIALSEYYLYGKPIEETIKNIGNEYTKWKDGIPTKESTNILDYAGRGKFKSDSKGIITYSLPESDENSVWRTFKVDQQKTTRYYVSNTGGVFTKHYNDGRISIINKGYLVSEYNRHKTSGNSNTKTEGKCSTNRLHSKFDKILQTEGTGKQTARLLVDNREQDRDRSREFLGNNDVNYKFYINECNKIINVISPKITQLNLFEYGYG